ncbi:hypothetical protein L9F63_004679, partial [Diploptera punctata]
RHQKVCQLDGKNYRDRKLACRDTVCNFYNTFTGFYTFNLKTEFCNRKAQPLAYRNKKLKEEENA